MLIIFCYPNILEKPCTLPGESWNGECWLALLKQAGCWVCPCSCCFQERKSVLSYNSSNLPFLTNSLNFLSNIFWNHYYLPIPLTLILFKPCLTVTGATPSSCFPSAKYVELYYKMISGYCFYIQGKGELPYLEFGVGGVPEFVLNFDVYKVQTYFFHVKVFIFRSI